MTGAPGWLSVRRQQKGDESMKVRSVFHPGVTYLAPDASMSEAAGAAKAAPPPSSLNREALL